MNRGLFKILILVIISLFAIGLIFAWKYFKVPKEVKAPGEEIKNAKEVVLKDEVTGWNIYKDFKYGFEFKYPSHFFWQHPKIIPVECDYTKFLQECPQTEWPSQIPVKIEKQKINGIPFCVQSWESGDMHKRYLTKEYITVRGKECFAVKLVINYVLCDVIWRPEPRKKCEYENTVIIPETLEKVLSTFRFFE